MGTTLQVKENEIGVAEHLTPLVSKISIYDAFKFNLIRCEVLLTNAQMN